MNKKKVIKALEHLEKFLENGEIQNDALNEMFGPTWFEGTLGHLFAEQEAFYVDTIIDLCELNEEALNWFIYDCKFGNSPLLCVLENGKEITVDSIETFLETI